MSVEKKKKGRVLEPYYDGDYKKAMPVVLTDQHRGRLHACPICGEHLWSVWGHAEKHWQSHLQNMEDEIKLMGSRSDGHREEAVEGPNPPGDKVAPVVTPPPLDRLPERLQSHLRSPHDLLENIAGAFPSVNLEKEVGKICIWATTGKGNRRIARLKDGNKFMMNWLRGAAKDNGGGSPRVGTAAPGGGFVGGDRTNEIRKRRRGR